MPTWILCAGVRCAGKDTAADALARMIGEIYRDEWDAGVMTIVRTSFAAVAKREFCELNQLDYTRMTIDCDYKEHHRAALLAYANARRLQDADCFVRAVFEKHANLGDNDIVVVSDFRFANERQFLVDAGNRCIGLRICATDGTRCARGWAYMASVDESPSESGADLEIDFTVSNDSDFIALERELSRVLAASGIKIR